MANPRCGACDDLRDTSGDFIVNGVTESICESLHDNTGLNPTLLVLHTDEEDLHSINDCLVGRKADEIPAYDVCDWKEYITKLIPNIYETLRAMICAIGGAWEKITCLLNNISGNRFEPQVLYARSTTAADHNAFFEPVYDVQDIDLPTIIAPYDGVFIIQCCADAEGFQGRVAETITFYTSDETWTSQMEIERAQHFDFGLGLSFATNAVYASVISSAIKVNKNAHLKVKVNPYNMTSSNTGNFRIHQVCVTFIPTFELDVAC